MSAIETLAAVLIALVYWLGVWMGSTMTKIQNGNRGPWREAEDRAAHVHGVVRVLESSYDREDLEP